MLLGYNTNGFAHHRLADAIDILAEQGYAAVAITLDHYALNPFANDIISECRHIRDRLRRHGLRCVVETGARFLLDPRRKHQPTLLSRDPAGRQRRNDFLRRAIDVAAELEADAVSFWSGAAEAGEPVDDLWPRLVGACQQLADHAQNQGVALAFEPEPGMFIATLADFGRLHSAVGHPAFGLTLDVGHVHCLHDGDPAAAIHAWWHVLWNVHIEDMRRGVHDHLFFGEGDMDFAAIASALREIAYPGPVCVELSRHSHDAVRTAAAALAFLQAQGFILQADEDDAGDSMEPTDGHAHG